MSINLMSAIFRTEFRDLQDANGNTTKASTAKFICVALADHANDEGEGAYPSINKLAYKTSLSRTTVINALDALKHNGILVATGVSKYDTINYTVQQSCFSKDSQPAILVNLLDPPSQATIPPPVKPLDPNHPLTIPEPSIDEDEPKQPNSFTVYTQEIGLLTPLIANALEDWITLVPPQWVIDAIHTAAKNNARSWSYIEAILKRWKAQGNQNDAKQKKTAKPNEPKAFEGIRQFLEEQNVVTS